MRFTRFLILGLAAAFAVAGCGGGGGSGVHGGDIAVVGSIHIKRSQFDEIMEQGKVLARNSHQPFPKAGSQEFAALKNRAVAILVLAAERELRAKEMGITISDKQIDQRVELIKNKRFQGNDKLFKQALKEQGFTGDRLRATIKLQLIDEAVVEKTTAGLKVGDDEVHDFYITHAVQFATPQSREVRQIRVAVDSKGVGVAKAKNGAEAEVDFAKSKQLADKVYADLKGGASFVALVKKYSQDTGTRELGGKTTISRGRSAVPEFEKVAFSLKAGELSKPVKTVYGWHIIQAIGPVHAASTTPEKQVRESIRARLLQDKKNQVLDEWSKETEKKFRNKVSYASGFKPPEASGTTTTTG